jgi:hypothetical protein
VQNQFAVLSAAKFVECSNLITVPYNVPCVSLAILNRCDVFILIKVKSNKKIRLCNSMP